MSLPLIVGISGASGIVYGVRALELLREAGVETHLVLTKSAALTLHHELDMDLDDIPNTSAQEVPVQIKSMKNHRCSDEAGVIKEALEHGGFDLAEELAAIFNAVLFATSPVPTA